MMIYWLTRRPLCSCYHHLDAQLGGVVRRWQHRPRRRILSQHSTVFADMFSLPPEEMAETYQGCTVVYMEAESAVGLKWLLWATHDQR